MRYPDTVEFLYSLGNELKTVKFGLEAITQVLGELGNPQRRFRSVHVAGTNGKGSTCAAIEAGLRFAGHRTGLYTSPHLIEPTERIRINGQQVSTDDFARAFHRVHTANERLITSGVLEHHTTYFETVTAMAFLLFEEADVEIAVVETGLGGRLDATNVVAPELCVITPIDFDHETFLGSGLTSIASEKAGILKAGVPAVFATQRPEALEVLVTRAAELNVSATRTDAIAMSNLVVHKRGSEFRADGERVVCPLAGRHQVENVLAAFAALRQLGVSPEGIARAKWPGRLDTVSQQPEILLDGAHNPAGARALASHLHEFYADRMIWMIYGAMRDKSVEEITETLLPLADRVILTAPKFGRAIRPDALLSSIEHPRAESVTGAAAALDIARTAPPGVTVVITGSLYLIGEVLALLQ